MIEEGEKLAMTAEERWMEVGRRWTEGLSILHETVVVAVRHGWMVFGWLPKWCGNGGDDGVGRGYWKK